MHVRTKYGSLVLNLALVLLIMNIVSPPAWGQAPSLTGNAVADSQHWNVELIGEIGGNPYRVEKLDVQGNYAYLASTEGIHVMDVSNPSAPVETGYYDAPPTGGYIPDLLAKGVYVYVANLSAGLRIVNVADPAHPIEAGFYDTPGESLGVAVEGDYAYVGDAANGLLILDISDISHPVEVASCHEPDHAGVAIYGDYAFTIDYWHSRLRVTNVAIPGTPGCGYSEFAFSDHPYIAVIENDRAYVAAGYLGLRVLDVSNPASLSETGTLAIPGIATNLDLSGSRAYLAANDGGLRVVDVSNPSTPSEIGYYVDSDRHIKWVAARQGVQDDYIFAAFTSADQTDSGLLIFRYTGGEPTATPTPTTTQTPTTAPTPTRTPFAWHTSTPTVTRTPTSTRIPTQTPTSTPVGAYRLTLQQGANGYAGADDTWIDGWSPDTNYGNSDTMKVRSGGWMSSLVRFDLSQVPAGATIIEADLALWAIRRSNDNPTDIDVHQVTTTWDATGATWNDARVGIPWQSSGGDFEPSIVDSATVSTTEAWYHFDLASTAQQWVDTPNSNHGVILRSTNAYGVEYEFTTSDHLADYTHPILNVLYEWIPTPTPTVTLTPTPTSTHTRTATPTPTPTATPIRFAALLPLITK